MALPRLALRDDATLTPVTMLDPSLRARLGTDPGGFVLTLRRGRAPATWIDADAAALLRALDGRRSLAEAIDRLAEAHALVPEALLEHAAPLLDKLIRRGFLVDLDTSPRAIEASLEVGARFAGCTVEACLRLLDDTEVYRLRAPGGGQRLLKLARGPRLADQRLVREAGFLTRLDGRVTPRLFAHGHHRGRRYLSTIWHAGTDAWRAAARWRDHRRHRLLAMCRAIASAYASIHARGVLHGDVHAHNLLVHADETGDVSVTVIDFGLGRFRADHTPPATDHRGGNPRVCSPERARRIVEGAPPRVPRAVGEQFAVAALLDLLVVGRPCRDLGLLRDQLHERILRTPPRSFAARGAAPWPALEAVLRRGLATEPSTRFPSSDAFADALRSIAPA